MYLELSPRDAGLSAAARCCTVAVNRSYYAAERGTRVDLPAVCHSVIAFNALADNAAQTLAKGMTVTVTG